MKKELVNPKELFDGSVFGMSQAIRLIDSGLIFVSGQVAWDLNFQVTHSSIDDQLKVALDNLTTALEHSNSTVDHVVHVKIYVRGEIADHMESIQPILSSFFGKSRPTLTGIGVASLASKDTLVEVEAIASTVK